MNVCNNDGTQIDLSTLITAGDPNGNWSIASGAPAPGTFDSTTGSFTAAGNTEGLIEFQYEINGLAPCPNASTIVSVNIAEEPEAEIETNSSICNTNANVSTVNFDDFILNGDTGGTWTDDSGSGAIGSFPNLDFDGIPPGNYIFTYNLSGAVAPCTNPSYLSLIHI